MAEILIHLPLFTVDGDYKFWCEIFDSLVKKKTIWLHFSPSASVMEMKFWYYVFDDMRCAYANFIQSVRSGVKIKFSSLYTSW